MPDSALHITTEQFFEQVLEAAQEVRARSEYRVRRNYEFGPCHLSLEVLSPELDRYFGQALGPGSPEPFEGGEILALEGAGCPTPPWGGRYVYSRRSDISGYACERFLLSYNVAAALLCFYDREKRVGIYWAHTATVLPGWERTAPLRTLLHWHGLSYGLQLTHGAVVNGLLLAGKGGSGKSTTALACLEAGFPYLCDDYCFTRALPEPRAFSVYLNARVHLHSLQWLATLSDKPRRESDEKISLELAAELQPEMPIKALVLPRLAPDHQGESLEPVEAAEGMKALTLVTMAQLAGAGGESFAILSALCHSLPNYRLHLNRPATEIPPLLDALSRCI